MNTPRVRLLALVVIAPILAAFARADEASYASILKERDAVLTQILALREKSHAIGLAQEESVLSARLALFGFRRDTATSTSEKIKQQVLIVGVWQKKLESLKNRAAAGVGNNEEMLVATDSHLQARQVLEELKLGAKKG